MVTIVMDVDGTILDAMPSYNETFSSILLEHCKLPKDQAVTYYTRNAGMELFDQFKEILQKNGEPHDDNIIMDLIDKFWGAEEKSIPRVYDDVIPTFEMLKDYDIHIASGTRSDVLNSRMGKSDIQKYIKKLVGWSPDYTKRLHFEHLSKVKERVVYVGDAIEDMKMAKNFGMVGVGIVREGGWFSRKELEEAGADYVIDDLRKLKDIADSVK